MQFLSLHIGLAKVFSVVVDLRITTVVHDCLYNPIQEVGIVCNKFPRLSIRKRARRPTLSMFPGPSAVREKMPRLFWISANVQGVSVLCIKVRGRISLCKQAGRKRISETGGPLVTSRQASHLSTSRTYLDKMSTLTTGKPLGRLPYP